MTKAWAAVKLLYLYVQYWIIGLAEDGYQVCKGQYLLDLGLFAAAAKAFQRALQDSPQSPYVYSALGFCYLNLGLPDRSIEYLTTAYRRRPTPETGLSLLHALHDTGRTAEWQQLLCVLKREMAEYGPEVRSELERFERSAGVAARLAAGVENAPAE